MRKCRENSCDEKAVFLEGFCWQHVDEQQRLNYAEKLLKTLRRLGTIRKENFKGVAIPGTKFPRHVGFPECSFVGTDLSGSTLEKADLRGADFTGAILIDCHFEDCDFRGKGLPTYLPAAPR